MMALLVSQFVSGVFMHVYIVRVCVCLQAERRGGRKIHSGGGGPRRWQDQRSPSPGAPLNELPVGRLNDRLISRSASLSICRPTHYLYIASIICLLIRVQLGNRNIYYINPV